MKFKASTSVLVTVTLILCSLLWYLIFNRFWLSQTEQLLYEYLKSSNEVKNPVLVNSILRWDSKITAGATLCILGAYQTKLEFKNQITGISKEQYQKMGAVLVKKGFRQSSLSFLKSESHSSIVLFNLDGEIQIYEIAIHKIPVYSPADGGECFQANEAMVDKVQLTQYPFGTALKFSSLK